MSRYVVSWYGQQVCVGLLEKEGAEEEINFAHNTFKSYCNEYLFHGALNFKSIKQFMKFLILKEYQPKLMDNIGANKQKRKELLQESFDSARETWENNVSFRNFVQEIYKNENPYMVSASTDQRDWDDEEFEQQIEWTKGHGKEYAY
jgi:hypothetical protein